MVNDINANLQRNAIFRLPNIRIPKMPIFDQKSLDISKIQKAGYMTGIYFKVSQAKM